MLFIHYELFLIGRTSFYQPYFDMLPTASELDALFLSQSELSTKMARDVPQLTNFIAARRFQLVQGPALFLTLLMHAFPSVYEELSSSTASSENARFGEAIYICRIYTMRAKRPGIGGIGGSGSGSGSGSGKGSGSGIAAAGGNTPPSGQTDKAKPGAAVLVPLLDMFGHAALPSLRQEAGGQESKSAPGRINFFLANMAGGAGLSAADLVKASRYDSSGHASSKVGVAVSSSGALASTAAAAASSGSVLLRLGDGSENTSYPIFESSGTKLVIPYEESGQDASCNIAFAARYGVLDYSQKADCAYLQLNLAPLAQCCNSTFQVDLSKRYLLLNASVLNFHYHPSSASSGDPDAKNREKTREEETRTWLEGSLTIEVFLIYGEPLPPQLLALTRIEVLTAEDIQNIQESDDAWDPRVKAYSPHHEEKSLMRTISVLEAGKEAHTDVWESWRFKSYLDSYAVAGVQVLTHIHSGSARALQDALVRTTSLYEVAAAAAEAADEAERERLRILGTPRNTAGGAVPGFIPPKKDSGTRRKVPL